MSMPATVCALTPNTGDSEVYTPIFVAKKKENQNVDLKRR
jgi:hypothetical protein